MMMADKVKTETSKSEDGDEEENEEEEEEMEEEKYPVYDPKEFENLDVDDEMRRVFSFIGLYTPPVLELEFELKPFIPDYMPAVGDVDPFIKVSLSVSLSVWTLGPKIRCKLLAGRMHDMRLLLLTAAPSSHH